MAVSMPPFQEIYPMAPPYIPLELGSSSLIISIALILGAPDSVPAGKVAFKTSMQSKSLEMLPVTLETMCIT